MSMVGRRKAWYVLLVSREGNVERMDLATEKEAEALFDNPGPIGRYAVYTQWGRKGEGFRNSWRSGV